MTGFFHDPAADPEQYLFGSGQVDAPPLQTDRNWSSYFIAEDQLWPWGDSLACASFNSLRILTALIKRQWSINRDYSDRALAKYTETDKKMGNDPHFINETVRRYGVPFETAWPSLRDLASFAAFYTTLPAYVIEAFQDFLEEFSLQHDTVRQGNYPTLQDAIWDALQYSPIGASFGYNSVDENGYWYKAGNHPDTHWAPIVSGEYGKYFLISDTAEPYAKKIAWASFNPQLVKRYAVFKRQPTVEEATIIVKILTAIRDWWQRYRDGYPVAQPESAITPPIAPPANPTPTPAPEPTTAEKLYNAAYNAIGHDISPRDQASDEVGCAESLSMVIAKVMKFDTILSTSILNKVIAADPRFQRVDTPTRGCVTIFPTIGTKVGHCGVWGDNYVMSNTSKDGIWRPNYTHAEWLAEAKKRGLQLYHYLPLRSIIY